MNSKAQALVAHFTGLSELTDYYEHRFKELLKSTGRVYDEDPVLYAINVEAQTFTLKTEYRYQGDTSAEKEYDTFPLSDLDVDIEELNRREKTRLAREATEREARRQADIRRQAAITEDRDRKEYTRLKAKYESNP